MLLSPRDLGGDQRADDAERHHENDRERHRPAFIQRGKREKDDDQGQGVKHRSLARRSLLLV